VKKASKKSLASFAALRAAKAHACKVCETVPIKLLIEVDAGLRNGVGTRTIADWLSQVYHIPIGRESLRNHRRKHVK
jgi:hypothetical protein